MVHRRGAETQRVKARKGDWTVVASSRSLGYERGGGRERRGVPSSIARRDGEKGDRLVHRRGAETQRVKAGKGDWPVVASSRSLGYERGGGREGRGVPSSIARRDGEKGDRLIHRRGAETQREKAEKGDWTVVASSRSLGYERGGGREGRGVPSSIERRDGEKGDRLVHRRGAETQRVKAGKGDWTVVASSRSLGYERGGGKECRGVPSSIERRDGEKGDRLIHRRGAETQREKAEKGDWTPSWVMEGNGVLLCALNFKAGTGITTPQCLVMLSTTVSASGGDLSDVTVADANPFMSYSASPRLCGESAFRRMPIGG